MDNIFRTIKVGNAGFVRLVDAMPREANAGDVRIVEAARTSYKNETKHFRSDSALIDYLMRNEHLSPFEMVELLFHVKMPIFLARQQFRHRTHSANEVSARYSVLPDEFHYPAEFRSQSTSNKQGSDKALPPDTQEKATEVMQRAYTTAYQSYRDLLNMGVSREQAREVIPVGIYTEFYWKQNLRNLLHLIKLRSDSHAQREVQDYANAFLELVRPIAPAAIAAWENHVRYAVKLSAYEVNILRKAVKQNTTSTVGELLVNLFINDAINNPAIRKSHFTEFKKKLGIDIETEQADAVFSNRGSKK